MCFTKGHFYRPQQSWGKVMFVHVSVILFTGGCLPQCMLGYTHPLGRHLPWVGPPGRHAPIPGQTPPGQTPPHSACWIRSTSGRYASYWNAILFFSKGDNMKGYRITLCTMCKYSGPCCDILSGKLL